MDRIFLENDNFKKLYTCFMELAKEEKQKVTVGDFVDVKITKAEEFDLYGIIC